MGKILIAKKKEQGKIDLFCTTVGMGHFLK